MKATNILAGLGIVACGLGLWIRWDLPGLWKSEDLFSERQWGRRHPEL
jgi:hypothetical protein